MVGDELPHKKDTGEAGEAREREDCCLKQEDPGINDEATMSLSSKPEYLKRMKWRYQQRGRRGRGPVYGAAELAVIKPIWRAAYQPCGKLLQPMLPWWLPHWEADHGLLEPGLKARLERISAATLDRLLTPSNCAAAKAAPVPATWRPTRWPTAGVR